MDQRLKCKTGYYKTLSGKHRTLFDLNFSNFFFIDSQRNGSKNKNKWDINTLRRFFHRKGNYKENENTNYGIGESIFSNDATDNILISKIYKQLSTAQCQKTNTTI